MSLVSFPRVASVQIEAFEDNGAFCVRPVWHGVDRPSTGGWVVKNMATARRLEKAIMDMAVFSEAKVTVDVKGQTYVATMTKILARTVNADLRKLGY